MLANTAFGAANNSVVGMKKKKLRSKPKIRIKRLKIKRARSDAVGRYSTAAVKYLPFKTLY